MINFPRATAAPMILALLVGCASSRSARAEDAQRERARMVEALSAYEAVASRRQLLAISSDAERLLRAIIDDPRGHALARHRAIGALRWFPSRDSRRLLRRLVERGRKARRGRRLLDLQPALESYAAATGPAALELALSFLDHRSIDVRIAAARAALLSKSDRAPALLRARLEREGSSTVRAEVRQLLVRHKKKQERRRSGDQSRGEQR